MKWTTTLLVAVALLVAAPAAQAQMGIGVLWNASGLPSGGSYWSTNGGIVPMMVFPIMIGEGLVLQPMLGGTSVGFGDSGSRDWLELRLGGMAEYHFGSKDVTPLFGAKGLLVVNAIEDRDGWTDISLGVFLGATANVVDNVSIVGQWGPTYKFFAKDSPGGDRTEGGTEVSLTLRWWVFGT